MTGLEKLVEWLDSKAGASVLVKDYWLEAADKARALLAEEAEQKPVEESVEGLCGTCNGYGIVQIAPNVRGMKTCDTCKGKGKMEGHRPVKEEPLEELAKRKGHRLELAGWLYRQDGSLVVQRAENMAALRAYLNGLDDVKREGI